MSLHGQKLQFFPSFSLSSVHIQDFALEGGRGVRRQPCRRTFAALQKHSGGILCGTTRWDTCNKTSIYLAFFLKDWLYCWKSGISRRSLVHCSLKMYFFYHRKYSLTKEGGADCHAETFWILKIWNLFFRLRNTVIISFDVFSQYVDIWSWSRLI